MASPIRSFYNECRYIAHSIGNPEAKKLRKVTEELIGLQRSTRYQFKSLKFKKPILWKDFWRILLKDAEQLRKNGEADLALEILNGAKELGLMNSWTEASRARSYEKIYEWPEALEIWNKLTTCKNKDVKIIAINELDKHQKKVSTLMSDLNTIIQRSEKEAKFLPKSSPICLQELEDPILAEIANLQESQSLALSIKILRKSIKADLSTPLIKEKLASLLCDQGRETETVRLWQSLLNSKNINIKGNAEKMIKELSNKFLDKLRSTITNAGQPIRHLPETVASNLSELEKPIIKESDALRNAKVSDLSLEILEISIKWGINTDTIKAKKARTLLSMKKTDEAIVLLTPLLDSNNKKAKTMAENIAKRHLKKVQEVKINLKIEKIFKEIKDIDKAIDSAIEMLTDEVLDDPNNEQLHRALQKVAMRRLTFNDQNENYFQELIDHNQKRAGLEALLKALEKRSHNKATKSAANHSE